MIKGINWFFILSAFCLLSCNEGGQKLFEMALEADFTVQPGLNTFDTHYFIVDRVPTHIRSYAGISDSTGIGHIFPNRAELNARFVNIDWAIVREISVWAVSRSIPGLKKEIFYHDRIDLQNVNELRLLSSLSNVRDILLDDFVDLEIRLNFRTFTPGEIQARLTMNFVVNGKE